MCFLYVEQLLSLRLDQIYSYIYLFIVFVFFYYIQLGP